MAEATSPVFELDTGNYSTWAIFQGAVNGSNWTDYGSLPSVSTASLALQVFLVLVVIVAALLGNALMVHSFSITPSLHTLNNLLTMNLGVADLGVGVLVLPTWLVSLAQGATSVQPPFSPAWCQFTACTTVLFLFVSVVSLAWIALDRYLTICRPLEYPMAVTRRRVYLLLLCTWLSGILLAVGPLLGWGVYTFRPSTVPLCAPYWRRSPSFGLLLFLLGLAGPFLCMLGAYTQVVRAARLQVKRIERIQLQLVSPSVMSELSDMSDDEQSRRPSVMQRLIRKPSTLSYGSIKRLSTTSRNLKTLKTVFIVVGAFFICWAPYAVVSFYIVHHPRAKVTYTADFVTTLLALTNSALNPYIFMLLNRDFRYALRLTIARCMSRVPGQADAVHRVRLSVHGDSMVDSARLPSRASGDSGVELETCLQREPSKKDNRLCPPDVHCAAPPKRDLSTASHTKDLTTGAIAASPKEQDARNTRSEPRISFQIPDKPTTSTHFLAPPPVSLGRPRRSRDKLQYDGKALNTRRAKKARASGNNGQSRNPGTDEGTILSSRPSIPKALGGLLNAMAQVDPEISNKIASNGDAPHSSLPNCNSASTAPGATGRCQNMPIPVIMVSDETIMF